MHAGEPLVWTSVEVYRQVHLYQLDAVLVGENRERGNSRCLRIKSAPCDISLHCCPIAHITRLTAATKINHAKTFKRHFAVKGHE